MPIAKPLMLFLLLVSLGGSAFTQCVDVKNIRQNGGYRFLNEATEQLQTLSPIPLDSALQPAWQQKFQLLRSKKILQKGYTPFYSWYRFTLCNSDASSKRLVVLFGGLGIRQAYVWERENSTWKQTARTGYTFPFASRSYPYVHQAFSLNLLPKSTKTFYIQVDESHTYQTAAFVLVDSYQMKLIEHRFYFLFGIITGLLLLFFVLNVYLFLSIREKIHLWYAAYIITIWFFLIKNEGLDAEFLGLDSFWAYRSTYMAAIADVSVGFLLGAVQLFLTNLAKHGVVNKILGTMKWLLFLAAFVEWLTFVVQPSAHLEAVIFTIARNIGLLSLLTIIGSCLYSFICGFRPALFLLIGQSLFLIGGISRALFWEADSFIFPPSLFEVGLLLEVAIISYGLMYRYNQYKRQKEQLTQQLEEQQTAAARQMVLTQEAEQKRIAEDLHDEIGGSLAAMKMTLQSFALPDPQATALVQLIDRVTINARHIAHNLMPPEFENTSLEELLGDYFRQLSKEGKIAFQFYAAAGNGHFTKQDELIIYRIIMEITSNIVKHSKATEATIQLVYHEDQLSLTAEDNGIGIKEQKQSGLGLRNIQSRINYLNGTATIDSSDRGSTIIIYLPYKK